MPMGLVNKQEAEIEQLKKDAATVKELLAQAGLELLPANAETGEPMQLAKAKAKK